MKIWNMQMRTRLAGMLMGSVVLLSGVALANHTIDASTGQTFNKRVLGKAIPILGERCERFTSQPKTLELSYDTVVRGVSGGASADAYDWRLRTGRDGLPNYPGRTTLEFLREARDRNSDTIITVNMRGINTSIAYLGWGAFFYEDTSLSTVVDMAAEWVRYCNFIAPVYTQEQTIPAGVDADIVNSLQWGEYDTLIADGEVPTNKVTYWEIGNEPIYGVAEWNAEDWSSDPANDDNYVKRYKAITTAMLAVDPTIKVGPCISTAAKCAAGGDFLAALLKDSEAVVDFISYHPYTDMGDVFGDVSAMEAYLGGVKNLQVAMKNDIIAELVAAGRDSSIPLIASESNVTHSWNEGENYMSTMAHVLGTVETLFAFNELGLDSAVYWLNLVNPKYGYEYPTYMLFDEMQSSIGDMLVDNYSDGANFRMYTTTNGPKAKVAIWGLNFSNSTDKSMDISLNNLSITPSKVTVKTLGNVNGVSTLLSQNEEFCDYDVLWTENELSSFDIGNLAINFKASTITVVLIEAEDCDDVWTSGNGMIADINKDCSVDLKDYSELAQYWFECYSPNDANCLQIW